jgi:hypothetical protein
MASSGMLRRVALVRTDVLEELSASFIIRMTKIDELGTLAVPSNRRRLLITAKFVPNSQILVILIIEAMHSSETSVVTSSTWHNFTEDIILHGHSREDMKI